MNNKYHYLISSLPDLAFDIDAKGSDYQKTRQDIASQLMQSDLVLWEAMYLHHDNKNLLSYLMQTGELHNPLAKYSAEELEQEVREPGKLHSYMFDFVEQYWNKEGDAGKEVSYLELETKLQKYFYEYAGGLNSKFIRRWFDFERSLRNVQAAFLSRKTKRDIANNLIGEGDLVEVLSRSNASDFGLKGEEIWLDRALSVFEGKDIVEREWRIDALRWEMADELCELEYFSIDVLLAYAAKMQIAERWAALGEEIGAERLKQLIAEIHSSFVLEKS
ncbi:MAG: DUF2764 domain-containing protein [Prevotellaceae bacterium]|jgi:hypothetical protein|nr:DUF2764 domain-containing protein [Prevotellaceae bacterium]